MTVSATVIEDILFAVRCSKSKCQQDITKNVVPKWSWLNKCISSEMRTTHDVMLIATFDITTDICFKNAGVP